MKMKITQNPSVLSIIFFILFVGSAVWYLFLISAEKRYFEQLAIIKTSPTPAQKKDKTTDIFTKNAPIILAFAALITGIGTFSMMILALLSHRNNRIETSLRIEKLELEIQELKSKTR